MALKRRGAPQDKKKSSVTFDNLPEGEHEGRLVYVADLGLHDNSKYDKPPCQKLALGIEIIGQTVTTEDGDTLPRLLWTKPFNIFHQLTEKGNELIQYKIFDPSATDGEVADWDAQLGSPVSVNVVHTKKDDAVYDNISSLVPIPKKYQKDVGPATIDPCIGDADDAENACTKALYGLTAWFYERRIDEGPNQHDQGGHDDAPPFNAMVGDDEIPF